MRRSVWENKKKHLKPLMTFGVVWWLFRFVKYIFWTNMFIHLKIFRFTPFFLFFLRFGAVTQLQGSITTTMNEWIYLVIYSKKNIVYLNIWYVTPDLPGRSSWVLSAGLTVAPGLGKSDGRSESYSASHNKKTAIHFTAHKKLR